MSPTRHVGIRDVARAAGVSVTTVSHALNDKPGVSEATRANVVRVATDLGYQPDPRGRQLSSGRSGLIALTVSVPDGLSQPVAELGYHASVISGIASAVTARELALVIVPSGGEKIWRRLTIDGAIVVDPAPGDPAIEAIASADIPVVTIGRPLGATALESALVVDNDYERGTRAVLDHLVDRGAETVSVMSTGSGQSYEVDSIESYRRWSRDRGTPARVEELPIGGGDELTVSVARAVADRLDGSDLPDAIHCVEEVVAASLLTHCRARGIKVPDDLLVSSISDRGLAETLSPTLTTLELHPLRLGAAAASGLADVLNGGSVGPGPVTIPTTVVVRGSTTPRS